MIQKTFPKIAIFLFLFCTGPTIIGQQLNNFDYQGNIEVQLDKTSQNAFQFNGYTNYSKNKL